MTIGDFDPETDGPLGTAGPMVILVGVDGSRTSWRAAAYAAGLARRQGALLIALHVRADATAAPGAGVMADAQEAAAAELRAELLTSAGRTGLHVELAEDVGDPCQQITRWADERDVDLVVVGSSEQAGHRLVGSTAVRLVRTARWPVTVVP